jgi:hypothetical protein
MSPARLTGLLPAAMCHQKRNGSDAQEAQNPGFRELGGISKRWQGHGKQAYDTQ